MCNRHGCCQLCSSWTFLPSWFGWPSERAKVHSMLPFLFTDSCMYYRQCNMDYLFSIIGIEHKISYDIACQWFINLGRMCTTSTAPSSYTPTNSHSAKGCQISSTKSHRSLSWALCIQLHFQWCMYWREGVERNWKGLNGQAPSTSEMGAGACYDTLDNCCRHMNWRKMVGMGECVSFLFLLLA